VRHIALLALFLLCEFAGAQGAGDTNRGSTPPGLSQDGARPAEGAIQGGSIAPGEKGGMPQKDVGKGATAGGSASRVQRCYELEGSLREQCLADEALNKETAPVAPKSSSSPRPGSPR
jgi:hypothetical protein